MAAIPLLTLEAANIFVGNDPTASNHLTLRNVKFPTMEKAFVDFMPGGGMVGLEVDTHFNKLDVTFTLAGWSAQAMSQVGLWATASQQFSLYGMLRNRLNGTTQQVSAVVWGMLSRAAPSEFERANLATVEYGIHALTHYEMIVDGTQIYFWDMATNSLIIGGVDVMADQNSALMIAGGVGSGNTTNPVTQTVG